MGYTNAFVPTPNYGMTQIQSSGIKFSYFLLSEVSGNKPEVDEGG